MRRSNTCRFCKQSAWSNDLIKYGTRAYAHPTCYATHKTVKDTASLPLLEKRKLETFIREEAEITRRIAREHQTK
jgi:hypothetical protein